MGSIVDRYQFDVVAGGEGEFRGGRGLIRDYRIISDDGGSITATFGRHKFLPWGVEGGRDGSPNTIEFALGMAASRSPSARRRVIPWRKATLPA